MMTMELRNAQKNDYPSDFLSRLPEFQERIGYRFQNERFLWIALTHSSFSNEKKGKIHFEHNERQEFLGDSVLSMIVSKHIFADHQNFPEGMLTQIRAAAVCADALYEYAQSFSLGSYMLLNYGLDKMGGRHQKNVLADGFEALLAALFLDGGIEVAESFVMRFVEPKLQSLLEGGALRDQDYKSLLQEKVQTSPGEKLEYRLVSATGPDHDKQFEVEVYLNSNCIGSGVGRSKREAQQEAARIALSTWFGEA